MERKGAAYRITQKRDAQDPNNVMRNGRRPSGSNVSMRSQTIINKRGVREPLTVAKDSYGNVVGRDRLGPAR